MSILDEIEARAREATPGPWYKPPPIVFSEPAVQAKNYKTPIAHVVGMFSANQRHSNAEFIAAARSDVPLLCRALRRLAEKYAQDAKGIINTGGMIEWALQEAQDDQSDG